MKNPKTIQLFLAGTILLSLVTTSARASPEAAVNVQEMADESDLVVIGRISAPHLSQNHERELFSVVPLQILKGNIPNTIWASATMPPDAQSEIKEGEFGIFFLRLVPEGYIVADAFHPVVVGAPLPDEKATPETLFAIASSLANVFATPPSQLIASGILQDRPYSSFAKGRIGEHIYSDASDAIETIPPALALSSIKAVVPDVRNTYGQIWQKIVEVHFGDEQALQDIVSILTKSRQSQLYTLYALNAIEHARWGKDAVPALSQLLSSDEGQIREAAVHALRRDHSDSAVSILRDKALQDPDGEVRTYAVLGLCEATHACHGMDEVAYFARPENRGKFIVLINHALQSAR